MNGEFVRVGSRAGEIGLTILLARAGGVAWLDGETREMGREVVLECRGMGGTLGLRRLVYQMRSLNPRTPPFPILKQTIQLINSIARSHPINLGQHVPLAG